MRKCRAIARPMHAVQEDRSSSVRRAMERHPNRQVKQAIIVKVWQDGQRSAKQLAGVGGAAVHIQAAPSPHGSMLCPQHR